MLALFILAILLSLVNANAQDYIDNGIDSSGEDSYSNSSNCIGKYTDLQSYNNYLKI